MTSITNIVISF